MLPDTPTISTAANLPDAVIAAYRRDGFVKIPGIITPEEAERYRQDALALAERMNPFYNGPIFTQLVNAWRESDAIRALTMHPNVAAVAEKLAGVPLRLWHDHLLIKQPHNHAPTEFHQDQPFWPHSNFAPRAFGLDRAGGCAGGTRLHDLHPRRSAPARPAPARPER